MRVFAALLLCFGLAFITGSLGLSSALEPIWVVFIAILFVSMGMLIDASFLGENWVLITVFVLGVFTCDDRA